MYLELHNSDLDGPVGSRFKKIDALFDPFDIETQAGEALQSGLARFAFAVSLFRVEAVWVKLGDTIYIAGAESCFCEELEFPLLNSYINDISIAVVGDTFGPQFEEAEAWAAEQMRKQYDALAVVLDTKGVRAAWWRDQEQVSLVALNGYANKRCPIT